MCAADTELDSLVQNLASQCLANAVSIATAESCTGGGVGAAITSIAGSSGWYLGGVVSYSNQLKQQLLQVPAVLLESQGAVSEACAQAMLEGLLGLTGADLGAAVTGIAGPQGGTQEKPVGTVCFAVGGREKNLVKTLVFEGDRQSIRRQSVVFALRQLLQCAQGWSNP